MSCVIAPLWLWQIRSVEAKKTLKIKRTDQTQTFNQCFSYPLDVSLMNFELLGLVTLVFPCLKFLSLLQVLPSFPKFSLWLSDPCWHTFLFESALQEKKKRYLFQKLFNCWAVIVFFVCFSLLGWFCGLLGFLYVNLFFEYSFLIYFGFVYTLIFF